MAITLDEVLYMMGGGNLHAEFSPGDRYTVSIRDQQGEIASLVDEKVIRAEAAGTGKSLEEAKGLLVEKMKGCYLKFRIPFAGASMEGHLRIPKTLVLG